MMWKINHWVTAPNNEDRQNCGTKEFSSIEELCEFLTQRYGGKNADQSWFGWDIEISISKEKED